MSLRSVVLFVVGALLGVAGHVAWSSAHPGPQQGRFGENADGSSAALQPLCTADWGAMRAEVKQAVRDVLQEETASTVRRSAAGAGAAGGGASPAPTPTETDDNKQAREAQAALLAAAIRVGHWTNEDVMKLRGLIPRMAPADRPKALAAVSKAINDGQLKVDGVLPF
jgi:hypothetical protein